MEFPGIVLGLVLLVVGRNLFWLFVSIVGFLFGMGFAGMIFPDQPQWIQVLFALGTGFLGALILIFIYTLFLWLSLRVIERTTDKPARLLASGIVAMIVFQILVNIGMTVGLMPVVGLPLPFLSYGGSSLVVMLVAVGFLISIYKERSIF